MSNSLVMPAYNSKMRVLTSTITRPADTAIYAAGDAMTDSTSAPTSASLVSATRDILGSGIILNAQLIDSANQATAGSFEVWVSTTAFTPDNDNAVFTPTDAECAKVIAIIPFSTAYVGDATVGAGGNRVYVSDIINKAYVTETATTLYWYLVARNAYTPVSAETFTLVLQLIVD